ANPQQPDQSQRLRRAAYCHKGLKVRLTIDPGKPAKNGGLLIQGVHQWLRDKGDEEVRRQRRAVERALDGRWFDGRRAAKLKRLAPIVGYKNRASIRRAVVELQVSQQGHFSGSAHVRLSVFHVGLLLRSIRS